jgi:hypothetical protein
MIDRAARHARTNSYCFFVYCTKISIQTVDPTKLLGQNGKEVVFADYLGMMVCCHMYLSLKAPNKW